MPPPVPETTRKSIVDLWLGGLSYRDISPRASVSLGTITNIIGEERKRNPGLDYLKALSDYLFNAKATIADALRGAQLLSTIDKSILSALNLSEFVKFYSQAGDAAQQIIAAGNLGIYLHQTTGLGYPELIQDIQSKTQARDQLQHSINILQAQDKQLRSELPELERLKKLDEKIRKRTISYEQLDKFLERASKLESLGFTEDAAEILAQELRRFGFTPTKAAGKLPSIISEHQTLQESARKLKLEVQNFTDTKMQLEGEIENRKQQKKELDRQLSEVRAIIDRDDEQHKTRKIQQEREISQLSSTKARLKQDCARLEEVSSNTSQIESSLDKLENRIDIIRKLATLEELVKNPERKDLQPSNIMTIALPLVESLRRYAANPHYSLKNLDRIKARLEELEKELTGWVQLEGTGSA